MGAQAQAHGLAVVAVTLYGPAGARSQGLGQGP